MHRSKKLGTTPQVREEMTPTAGRDSALPLGTGLYKGISKEEEEKVDVCSATQLIQQIPLNRQLQMSISSCLIVQLPKAWEKFFMFTNCVTLGDARYRK